MPFATPYDICVGLAIQTREATRPFSLLLSLCCYVMSRAAADSWCVASAECPSTPGTLGSDSVRQTSQRAIQRAVRRGRLIVTPSAAEGIRDRTRRLTWQA